MRHAGGKRHVPVSLPMTRIRRQLREIERLESKPAVIPPTLEQAFIEIEKPMIYFADATPETRATAPRMAQDARSNAR